MARPPQTVFEELQRLGEQRQQVHKEVLLRLQNTLHTVAPGRASSAALPSTAGLKRLTQVGSVGGNELKRQRTGQNADPGAEALWRQCGALMKKLWDSKHGITFHKPVDPVLYGIPNYFQVIKNPMDFTTIKSKLNDRKYSTPDDFAADTRLVFANCMLYNGSTTPTYEAGRSVSDIFERKWVESGIMEQWNNLSSVGQALPPHESLVLLGQKLQRSISAAPASAVGQPDISREMSFAEKRKLSQRLGDLQGNELRRVLEIVAEGLPQVDIDSEAEIELDIDSLPIQTLWQLKEYCEALGAGGVNTAVAGGSSHHQTASRHHQHSSQHHTPGRAAASGGHGQQSSQPQQQHETAAAVSAKGGSQAHGMGNGSMHDGANAESKGDDSSSSGSDTGDSEHGSPKEVNGSTMDAPDKPHFHRDSRAAPVEESMAASTAGPGFLSDRSILPKSEGQLNTAAWADIDDDHSNGPNTAGKVNSEAAAADGEGEDELFANFKTMEEEQQRKKAEDDSKREAAEREQEKRRTESLAQKAEEERLLAEAEEAQKAREAKDREDNKERELEGLNSMANTAQLAQPDVMHHALAHLTSNPTAMHDLGLTYKNIEDEGMDFDD